MYHLSSGSVHLYRLCDFMLDLPSQLILLLRLIWLFFLPLDSPMRLRLDSLIRL
jgi:hypothetical protein